MKHPVWIDRRWAVLVTAAVLAVACGGQSNPVSSKFPSGPKASDDSGPLTVLTFSGYDNSAFDATFHAAYPNVKINYEIGDTNEAFFQKIKSGGVKADIVFGACVNFLPNWQKSGLIAPIDTSRLSNWKDLNPDAEKLGVVGGQQWQAVTYFGYDSIVAAKNRSVPPPTSWKDLWSPTYKGQFSMINYAENGVQMAAVAYGLPYPNLTDAQLSTIKDKLMALRQANIKSFWTAVADPVQQLTNGEVEAFYGWPSQYQSVVKAGVSAIYVNPSEGRLSWSCGGVVMANTKHYDLALQWLNSRVSPEMGAQMVDTDLLGVPSAKAMALADQSIVKAFGYDDPAVFRASHPAAALTDEQRVKFNQMWQQVIAGS